MSTSARSPSPLSPSPTSPSPRQPPAPAQSPCLGKNNTAVACERDAAYISAAFLALIVLVTAFLAWRCRSEQEQERRRKSSRQRKRDRNRSESSDFSRLSRGYEESYSRDLRGSRRYGTPERQNRGRGESADLSFGSNFTPGRANSFGSESAGSTSGQSISSSVLYGGSTA